MEDLEEFLTSRNVLELKFVCKEYKLKVSGKKQHLITTILTKYKETPTHPSPKELITSNEQLLKDKALKIKEKTLSNIKIKNIIHKEFNEHISNSNNGTLAILNKNCFDHIISYLGELSLFHFSLSNKEIRVLCNNPKISNKMKEYIGNYKDKFYLIPSSVGEFLQLPIRFKVNMYYLITKKLFKYLLLYSLRDHITITTKQIGKTQQLWVGYTSSLSQFIQTTIHIKTDTLDSVNANMYCRFFMEMFCDVVSLYWKCEVSDMEWFYESEKRYKQLVEELIVS
jgi:hypothetical protein